jgi:hypothetical protein
MDMIVTFLILTCIVFLVLIEVINWKEHVEETFKRFSVTARSAAVVASLVISAAITYAVFFVL